MKKLSVLIVLLVLIFSCTKSVTVEKKFDVLKNVTIINNSATIFQLDMEKETFIVTSTLELPKFNIGDSLTGKFLNNKLQFVKDNNGAWLPVSTKFK